MGWSETKALYSWFRIHHSLHIILHIFQDNPTFQNILYLQAFMFKKLLSEQGDKSFFYLKYLLPLDGSGKIPWLLLLMTDGLGGCWLPWLEWDLPWSRLSVCSLREYHLGVLSRWAVLDKSISTWKKKMQEVNEVDRIHSLLLSATWNLFMDIRYGMTLRVIRLSSSCFFTHDIGCIRDAW